MAGNSILANIMSRKCHKFKILKILAESIESEKKLKETSP
jgi:hypothetical protein